MAYETPPIYSYLRRAHHERIVKDDTSPCRDIKDFGSFWLRIMHTAIWLGNTSYGKPVPGHPLSLPQHQHLVINHL